MKPNPNCDKCYGHGSYMVHGFGIHPDVVDCECTQISKWILAGVMLVGIIFFMFFTV